MISPETIVLVRERTDIVALITESVPTLKRRGRSWVGLCPFHKEKTGSFHVNPDRGFFHCFGCKEAGSAIDFVMKLEGQTFPEAVRSLAERAGVPIEEDHRERTEVDRQKKQKDDFYAVNALAATFFEHQLREHPSRRYALDELARRGLRPSWAGDVSEGATWGTAADDGTRPSNPDESDDGRRDSGHMKTSTFTEVDDELQAFRIGYAPPGWDGLASFLKAQSVSPAAAEQVGLLVPRSSGTGYYDRFRHRLMFAVVDPQGRVVAFSGRSLEPIPEDGASATRRGQTQQDPTARRGQDAPEKPPKYINSPESPVYTKGQMLFGIYQARHAIREAASAILVEGNFDVVSLHARGLRNVVAPLGTAFTLDQARLLGRFAQHVVVLFDGDAAGKKAVRLARGPLKEAGLSAKVAHMPDGTDPDDFARLKGVDALRELVSGARGMLEFLIEEALDDAFHAADAYERASRVEQISKLLADEDEPLVREMAKAYADQIAGRLDLVRSAPGAFRSLEQGVKKALASAGPKRVLSREGSSPRDARVQRTTAGSAERRDMVGALIEYPELLADPEISPALKMLEGDSARTIAALSDSFAQKGLDTAAFLAQIPSARHRAFAAERLASPRYASIEEAKGELKMNADKLQKLLLSQETDESAREQNKTEGDWETSMSLAALASERSKIKHGLKT